MTIIPNEELLGYHHGIFYPLSIKNYPDGMPLIEETIYIPEDFDTIIVRPKSLQSFVAAMFYVDARAERGHEIKNLILPFIPGSRQDRLNPKGDYLFTVKSVAQMINDRNFDHVVVIDPHSTVAPALIDRCFVYPMEEMWKTFWPGFSGIIAPDAGAGKRAFEVASIYKKKFLQAEKHRDVATGKLTGFACPNLKESEHYLIVDDICDGGGTFLGLGAVIEEAGAYATLFVTHGIFSQGTDKLNDTFTDVYTTDSTVFDRENVYTIRIVERMAEWATTL